MKYLIALAIFFATPAWATTGDPSFIALAKSVTFTKKHPVVLLDRGHHNVSMKDGRYVPLIHLLESDGYRVEFLDGNISAAALAKASIFYSVSALGSEGMGSPHAADPAYRQDEVRIVLKWVNAGGSFFILADHAPMAEAMEKMLNAFGVEISGATTQDLNNYLKDLRDPANIIYDLDKSNTHPIVRGRTKEETLHRVISFVGQSLKGPNGSAMVLPLKDTAQDVFPNGDKKSAYGRAQLISLSYGKGRVLASGDGTFFTSKIDTHTGEKQGMNHPGSDNVQLALNCFHWLSKVLP